jgi:hypothetical protein
VTTLTKHLTRQIEEQADNIRAVLHASAGRIAQAEQLAERLQSAGVSARAHGEARGPHILVWVTAGPIHADKLDQILTRLELPEADRFPGGTEWKLRLQGIDVPLYVMVPLPTVAAP